MNFDWHKFGEQVDKFFEGGWRKYFFWGSVTTMTVALAIVYIINPVRGVYAPDGFLGQMNASLLIVAALAGMRAIEKDRARTQEVTLAKVEAAQEVAKVEANAAVAVAKAEMANDVG